MPTLACHVALVLASGILLQGVTAAGDDLSDFSNNLAQDLGPLLALFGEPVTRQYLSESTTFLDYFIFAVCPLGIITAVTAAVRVCGHRSLRAFIGRSQEGNGVVEAELCTSTSRDVCELFSNGGITRVLGRPNILELVYAYRSSNSSSTSAANAAGADCPELSLFRDYLGRIDEERVSEWKKLGRSLTTSSGSSNIFAPKPNLSLNLGIKRQPSWVFIVVALTGVVLQVGVIVLAGFGAWKLGWNTYSPTNPSSVDYAPRMFIAGTALLCLGMCGCAALVGQATHEVTYKRRRSCSEQQSMLLWLQPGPQVVGDQSFDPFAHLENPSKPLDFWISSRKMRTTKTFEYLTHVAVVSTVLGYVLQFIGLRGMKAWVSIAQLAATLLMGFLRGLLRMQRFGENENALARMPDLVPGHELDWMAFEIARNGSPVRQSSSTLSPCKRFCDFILLRQGKSQPVTNEKSYPKSPFASRKAPSWHITGQPAAAQAQCDEGAESSPRFDGEVPVFERSSRTSLVDACQGRKIPSDYRRVFSYRARLAHLTGHFIFQNLAASEYQTWNDSLIRGRVKAKLLASAVEEAAKVLLQTWDGSRGKLPESISLRITTSNGVGGGTSREQEVHVTMKHVARSHWRVDSAQIEALLGLWMWSLLNDGRLIYADESDNMRSSAERRVESMQIISASLDDDLHERQTDAQDEMNMWLGSSGPTISQHVLVIGNEERCGHDDLWISSPGQPGLWQKLDSSLSNTHSVVRRYFGWNVVYESLGFSPFESVRKTRARSRQDNLPEGYVRLKIQAASRSRSLLHTCAIEVFSALICSLRSLEELDVRAVKSTLAEHDGHIQLENRTISGIGKAFVDSGLGTRLDVLLSVVPAFRNYIRPDNHAMMAGVVASAETYRRNGEWHRAQLLMQWACRQNLTLCGDVSEAFTVQGQDYASPLAYVLQRTGELYRWSLTDGTSKERRVFGIAGIEWMCQFLSNDSTGERSTNDNKEEVDTEIRCTAQRVNEVIERYKSVAERIQQDFADAELRQKAMETSQLIQALKDRDRADVLYRLCLVKAGSFAANGLRPAFPLAVRNGWAEVVDAILELRGNLDSQDDEGRTAASHCAETGQDWALGHLMEQGAFLDQADAQGRTPLHWAARAGYVSIVQTLIQSHQVDSDKHDLQGTTPLWDALHHGHISVVEKLLAEGISIESRRKDGQTVLIWAAQNGQLEMMKKLLEHGADVHQKGAGERTAVHWAAAEGHTSCLQLLIEHGSNIHQSDAKSHTPILIAAAEGHESCLDVLILHGAFVNGDPDQISECPLHFAARRGHRHIVQKLIQGGADVNWRCPSGRCALFEAASNYHCRTMELLLDNGAAIDAKDSSGWTCLHRTIYYCRSENTSAPSDVIRTLLRRGLDVNIGTSRDETGLLMAATGGHEGFVEILLGHDGIDVDKADISGCTPLMVAARKCYEGIVRRLLDHGADVNLADVSGGTVLIHHACNYPGPKDGTIVEMLLDRGAETDRRNKSGNTALDYACGMYIDALARILKERGARHGERKQSRIRKDEVS